MIGVLAKGLKGVARGGKYTSKETLPDGRIRYHYGDEHPQNAGAPRRIVAHVRRAGFEHVEEAQAAHDASHDPAASPDSRLRSLHPDARAHLEQRRQSSQTLDRTDAGVDHWYTQVGHKGTQAPVIRRPKQQAAPAPPQEPDPRDHPDQLPLFAFSHGAGALARFLAKAQTPGAWRTTLAPTKDFAEYDPAGRFSALRYVPISRLQPTQSTVVEEKIAPLIALLRSHPEKLAPLVVERVPAGKVFDVLDGHHRLEAARRAGITLIPVVVYTILRKAHRGEIVAGHGYISRDGTPGHYTYHYPENGRRYKFFVTIDSDSIRKYMPVADVLLPVSSWVRKAKLDERGHVVGAIPVPKLPAHLADVERGADGGGFVAMHHWGGEYRFTADQYVAWLDAWGPTWAAMLDYPVEPAIASTQMAIMERQNKTTANALAIWQAHHDKPWAWTPTIQGWTIEDYQRHAKEMLPLITEMQAVYHARGMSDHFRVGIGTLCARKRTNQIVAIVQAVAEALPGVPLHLWGVKLGALKQGTQLPAAVVSSDSAAWSGRFAYGLDKYKESDLSQREYAYTVALPAYQKKIDAAYHADKQEPLDLGAELYDWARLAKDDPMRAPAPMFTCEHCDTVMDADHWDFLDQEERAAAIHMLGDLGLCPSCHAPIVSKQEQKQQKNALKRAGVPRLLVKALKGAQALGHKYHSRKWDAQHGRWLYDYGHGLVAPRNADDAAKRRSMFKQKLADHKEVVKKEKQLSLIDFDDIELKGAIAADRRQDFDNVTSKPPVERAVVDYHDTCFVIPPDFQGLDTAPMPKGVPVIAGVAKAGANWEQALGLIEKSMRELPYEVGHWIDRDTGEITRSKRGKTGSVPFTWDDGNLAAGNIFTHNHPGGGSFSMADMECLLGYQMKEIRAVGQKWRYVMMLPPELDRNRKGQAIRQNTDAEIEHAIKRLKRIRKKHETALGAEREEKVATGEITYREATENFWHEAWSRTFAEMGWTQYYKRIAWDDPADREWGGGAGKKMTDKEREDQEKLYERAAISNHNRRNGLTNSGLKASDEDARKMKLQSHMPDVVRDLRSAGKAMMDGDAVDAILKHPKIAALNMPSVYAQPLRGKGYTLRAFLKDYSWYQMEPTTVVYTSGDDPQWPRDDAARARVKLILGQMNGLTFMDAIEDKYGPEVTFGPRVVSEKQSEKQQQKTKDREDHEDAMDLALQYNARKKEESTGDGTDWLYGK
jgi:hypothetical protein